MLPSVLTVRETRLVLVFTSDLLINPQQHFLANSRLKLESLVLRYGLPVADPARFDGFGLSPGSEDDVRRRILGIDLSAGVGGSDTCRPYARLVDTKAGDSPSLFGTNTADLVHDRMWRRAWCDEDVVGEEFEVGGVGVGRERDKGL